MAINQAQEFTPTPHSDNKNVAIMDEQGTSRVENFQIIIKTFSTWHDKKCLPLCIFY